MDRKERKIFNRIINSRGNYTLDCGNYKFNITKTANGQYQVERIKDIVIESIFDRTRMQGLSSDEIFQCIQYTDIAGIIQYIKNFSLNNNLANTVIPEYTVGKIDESQLRLICYAVVNSQLFDESSEKALIRSLQDYKKASKYKQINGRLRDKEFPIPKEDISRVKKDIAELTDL